jgi:hypothetical protein
VTAVAEHAEKQRRQSNKDKLLAHLLEHGSATNVELVHVAGMRFGARLMELRRDGWNVETIDLGRGLVRYTLKRATPVQSGQQDLFR